MNPSIVPGQRSNKGRKWPSAGSCEPVQGGLLFIGGASPDGGPHFPFNCTCSFRPNADELNADPYTGKAIANFATSLDFDIRPRQAKSEVDDCAFGETCRSVYKHSMQADVGRAEPNIITPAFVVHAEVAKLGKARLAACFCETIAVSNLLHDESTPSEIVTEDSETDAGPPVSRLVPQYGQ